MHYCHCCCFFFAEYHEISLKLFISTLWLRLWIFYDGINLHIWIDRWEKSTILLYYRKKTAKYIAIFFSRTVEDIAPLSPEMYNWKKMYLKKIWNMPHFHCFFLLQQISRQRCNCIFSKLWLSLWLWWSKISNMGS